VVVTNSLQPLGRSGQKLKVDSDIIVRVFFVFRIPMRVKDIEGPTAGLVNQTHLVL